MKKITIFLVLLLFLALQLPGNPLQPVGFSEIYFDDSDNWTIELYDYYHIAFGSLDGCYLESSSDTAYFNNGIYLNPGDTILITNANMQSDFTINKAGDEIKIRGNQFLDNFCWGDTPNSLVNSPESYQSLARVTIWTSGYPATEPSFILVKENEPSLGYNPFEAQTYGCLQGLVHDNDGNPLPDASIDIYPFDYHNTPINVNSDGSFEFSDIYGLNYNLTVEIPGYPPIDTTITVEPEDTTYIEISPNLSIGTNPNPDLYSISNYPNPFYNQTTIHYSLPGNSPASISIFNSKGQKIRELSVCGAKKSIVWFGKDSQNKPVPSGVYFYQLAKKTRKLSSGKMLYLK